jgi:RimJ/RimL family protein N-acetyltransferase
LTAITTARLVLRPLQRGDLGDLIRGLNNFAVSQWTARVPHPYGTSDAENYLAMANAVEPGTLRLSIAHGGTVIGGISYERSAGGASAEIGYWLAEPHWGRGYGREAARAMTDHAFEVAGHALLVAGYRYGNEASRRILAGLGFVKTGEAMVFSKAVGSEMPVVRLGLTRDGWLEAKGRRLC